MAKGNVIVNANVTDPEKYAQYRPLAEAAIAAFGGRYLARGGKNEILEGSLLPRGLVIEFDDYDTAVKWYHSARVRSGAQRSNGRGRHAHDGRRRRLKGFA